MKKAKKINTSQQVNDFDVSPFASLDLNGLQSHSFPDSSIKDRTKDGEVFLGKGERLEIRREKSGRGGKVVTTVGNFPKHINKTKKDKMLKELKTNLGTGGTWNHFTMELQGDKRENVYNWLSKQGFKPVLAGG